MKCPQCGGEITAEQSACSFCGSEKPKPARVEKYEPPRFTAATWAATNHPGNFSFNQYLSQEGLTYDQYLATQPKPHTTGSPHCGYENCQNIPKYRRYIPDAKLWAYACLEHVPDEWRILGELQELP